MRKLLITILIITSSLDLFAAYTADSALVFAEVQYKKGNYRLALKEYQRVSFHADFSDPYLQYRLGNCCLYLGDWGNARNYYDQVIRMAKEDSLYSQAKIQKISSLIREEDYKRALIDLYGIPDSLYQLYPAEINLLFAITHFGLEEFETSKNYFKKMVPGDPESSARIDSLFSKKRLLYRPNPKTAYILSLILPGLGQFYAGGYKEGLNSFLLNEALVVLAVYVTYQYTLIDAILAVLPWYQRYYMGGIENAKEIAILKRKERRSRVYRETLQVIRDSEARDTETHK